MTVILTALSASLALGDDFRTIRGKEYKDATVSRIEPDGIVLRTKSGIVKLYFIGELLTAFLELKIATSGQRDGF